MHLQKVPSATVYTARVGTAMLRGSLVMLFSNFSRLRFLRIFARFEGSTMSGTEITRRKNRRDRFVTQVVDFRLDLTPGEREFSAEN